MSRFLNESLKSFEAYVPGEQPKDKKYIKLNTNESPYPPSKEVLSIIKEQTISDLKLYCDPKSSELKKELALFYNVKEENIFVSNGSDESLNFFFMAFCSDKKPVVFPEISYGFYEVFCELYGIKYEKIPLKSDFSIDINDYINIGKNIVIANPNAPTGLYIPLCDIEKIVKSNPENLVVIDEAYVDFGGESAIPLTKKYDNLVVVQTFSKSRSLAGARLGYAVAHEDIISDLEKIKYSTNPYNINTLTQKIGVAAIKSQSYFDENCKKIIETREYLKESLINMGFFVTNSKTNFLFAKHKNISGEEIYLKLRENGILVRHFNTEKIKDFNRITIGNEQEINELISCLKEIVNK